MKNNKMSKVDQILNEKYNEMIEFYYKEGYSKSETISKVNYLIEEGFELADILNMQKKYPEFLKFNVKNNLQGIRNLKEYGFNDEIIKRLMINNPILFILSKRHSEAILDIPLTEENSSKENYAIMLYNCAENTKRMVDKLKQEVGYNTNGAININDYFKIDAKLFSLSKNYTKDFNEMINKLVDYGYSRQAALFVTSMCPKTLDGIAKNNRVELPENIKLFEKLSYKKDDIIKMTKLYPSLLKVSKEDIRDTLRYYIEKGFTKDEIISFTTSNPNVFSIVGGVRIVENIFLDDNPELIEELKYIPKKVEKDYNKTYRRYHYLKENGYIVDKNNFKLLFGNDHDFAIRYGMTDNLLVEKYDPFNGIKKSLDKLSQRAKPSKKIK